MKVIALVKSDEKIEAGEMPSEQVLEEMGKYNEEMAKAGILLAGEGLHPSSKGARIKLTDGAPEVIDGPFAEAKELVAGFWIWQVASMDEAIEWAKRCPNPRGEENFIELRPVFEEEDFGDEFAPDLREKERRLREQLEAQQQ